MQNLQHLTRQLSEELSRTSSLLLPLQAVLRRQGLQLSNNGIETNNRKSPFKFPLLFLVTNHKMVTLVSDFVTIVTLVIDLVPLYLVTGTDLSDPVVFGEPVVVKDGEHQGLVEGVRVRKIFELKSFIEKWIQSFSVNFRLKLFLSFFSREEEDLKVCKILLAAGKPHKLKRTTEHFGHL